MPEQWNKYAPTAARRHGRPGREQRPKSATIDIHSHVAVPAAAKFVEPYLDWATMPLAHFANAQTRAISQKQEADIRARVGHNHRLADLDAMGIDVQIIAPPPPQCYYTVPLEIAVKATQIVNDGIAEFCAVKSERLKGFGAVPMTDGGEASAENDSSTAAIVAACFWYAVPVEAWRSFCAEMAPHSVRIAPGSMMTTSMPNGRSSTRRLSLSPSTANLAAWSQSPSGS